MTTSASLVMHMREEIRRVLPARSWHQGDVYREPTFVFPIKDDRGHKDLGFGDKSSEGTGIPAAVLAAKTAASGTGAKSRFRLVRCGTRNCARLGTGADAA